MLRPFLDNLLQLPMQVKMRCGLFSRKLIERPYSITGWVRGIKMLTFSQGCPLTCSFQHYKPFGPVILLFQTICYLQSKNISPPLLPYFLVKMNS